MSLIFSALTVNAAHADVAASSPDSNQLQEVIVTANKRAEKIQQVPTSISVIGGNEALKRHIQDFEDITRSVPGISFSTQGGEGQDNIEIRGVSSNVGSQTVGIYLDDVPLLITNSYEGATQPKFLDMARIEVLRGPQGTLFGASSEGGTIRFISNQPEFNKFEGSIRSDLSGTFHGGVNYDMQGVVNIPLVTDKLAVRSAIEYGDQSGWINNLSPDGSVAQKGINDERDIAFRLSAKWKPDDDLTITPALFFQRAKQNDSPNFYPRLGVYSISKSVNEFSRDTVFVPSLTINKGVGFADVTSVTSYFYRQESRQKDGTFFNSGAIAQFFLDPAYPQFQPQNDNTLANIPSPVSFHDTWGTATQELRLTSKTPEETGLPIKYTVGLYYSDQWYTHRDYENIPGFSDAFQRIYGFNINDSVLGNGDPNLFQNDDVYYVSDRNDLRQYAAFGQLEWYILPQLHAGLGIRYLYAREAFTEHGGGFFELGNVGVTSPYSQLARFYAFTPKYTLTYDVTPDTSVYASAAKGFRLGGATSPNDNIQCLQGFQQLGITSAPTTYGSDQLWSYEAGGKGTFFNRTLSVKGAGYYVDWSRIQQSIIIPICGGQFNTNVGNAEAYGGELEIAYKPPVVRGLTLGVNASVERAVITTTVNAATAAPGDKVLFVPDWTANFSADYSWDINDDTAAFVRADYDWTGRSHGSFVQTDPNFSDKQYATVNASIGVDIDTLELALYAKNLTNDRTVIQQPIINSLNEGYTLRPLTVGVTATKRF